MSQGNIVQCIGAVVDIQFPRDAMPNIYNALLLDKSEEHDGCEAELVFEVQQQLGDGIVRTIAMGSTEGLQRGLSVEDTGEPIGIKRLEARPIATLTIEAQEIHERRERTTGSEQLVGWPALYYPAGVDDKNT